jgi:membrane-associated PAP2 superfamily phosphatase
MANNEILMSRRAGLRIFYGLAVCAAVILWIGTFTDLDLRIADAMYDSGTHSFPWRHAWLMEVFGHSIVKTVLTVVGVALIALCLGEPLLRKRYLTAWWRLRLRFLGGCAVLIPLTTSMLKQSSKSHCPWDLERYGGSQHYYRLLDHIPAWVDAGKCLPGGHASTALWLVGIAAFWLPHRPRAALVAAALSLFAGGVLGWMQQMRGAHFLTHTLWSIWIACAITFAMMWFQMLSQSAAERKMAPETSDQLVS